MTAALGIASQAGILGSGASAMLTAIPVLVASLIYLGTGRGRMLASFLGLGVAAAPALIFATSLLTASGRIGVPFDLLTTRLTLVVGWWVALATLRPLVLGWGLGRQPSWMTAVMLSPIAAVAGMCGLAWQAGADAGRTAQRLAFLYRYEDNAAWVSHAQAILRHGHLPQASESEYWTYSPLSSVPGLMLDVALRGRPASAQAAVTRGIDISLANQLLAVVVAACLIGLALAAAIVWHQGTKRPPVPAVLVTSGVLIGVGCSVAAASPLLNTGHLSLAWANVGLIALGIFATCALRAGPTSAFAAATLASGLSSFAAAGAWAYVVLTPVTFGGLLFAYRKSGLRVGADRPIGSGARITVLAAAIAVSSVVAAAPQVVDSLVLGGVRQLTDAVGAIPAVEGVTLAVAVLVALATVVTAYRREDVLSLVSALLLAGACVSAVLVYLSGVLPDNNPTYSLTKSLHVMLALTPLAGAALLAHALLQVGLQRVIFVGAVLTSVLVTTSPLFGAVLKWWGTMTEQSPAMATRLLDLSVRGAASRHVVCQPSPYLVPFDNYLCNRWTDALSRIQTGSDFRLEILDEGGSAPAAWAKAQETGLLRDAEVGNAAEVLTGSCVPPSETPPAAAPAGTLTVRTLRGSAEATREPVGSIDNVQLCSEQMVLSGWVPFESLTETLTAYTKNPVSITSADRQDRPDVIAATQRQDLVTPGFVIVLQGRNLSRSDVCLEWKGAIVSKSHESCVDQSSARTRDR